MKILYAAGMTAPLTNMEGLHFADALPAALCAQGADLRVVLPLSADLDAYRMHMQFLLFAYVELERRRYCCRLFQTDIDGVRCYFIENESYFRHERPDDPVYEASRTALFARALIKLLPMMEWKPEIVHCVDWQTALIPVYLSQEKSPAYRNIRTVFTLRDAAQQGCFAFEKMSHIFALPLSPSEHDFLRQNGQINLVKAAVQRADLVLTSSQSFAAELREAGNVYGLQRVVEDNSHKLRGILDGIDYSSYDPETDQLTYCAFNIRDLSGKAVNKSELQRNMGLDMDADRPVIACVSELVREKGLDMLAHVLDFLIAHEAQLVILGTGDADLERFFVDAESKYPGSVSANIVCSDTLARRVYAGADVLLVPSRTESRGQVQMLAMRYGTVPIVRQTGVLKDSVTPYPAPDSNGFAFAYDSEEDMLDAVRRALEVWRTEPLVWKSLVQRCMAADFSWASTAKAHLRLYEQLAGQR